MVMAYSGFTGWSCMARNRPMTSSVGITMAWNVVVGKLSDEDVATVTKALKEVCAADAYAVKELAGRFASGVKRVKVLRAIGRHPRAARFSTLCEAIEKGRFTASQWALAQKIAAEAPVE
jgi:hypothetical protein